jgi:hypothetical protein
MVGGQRSGLVFFACFRRPPTNHLGGVAPGPGANGADLPATYGPSMTVYNGSTGRCEGRHLAGHVRSIGSDRSCRDQSIEQYPPGERRLPISVWPAEPEGAAAGQSLTLRVSARLKLSRIGKRGRPDK